MDGILDWSAIRPGCNEHRFLMRKHSSPFELQVMQGLFAFEANAHCNRDGLRSSLCNFIAKEKAADDQICGFLSSRRKIKI